MLAKTILYAGLGAAFVPAVLGDFMFHGTSVLIYPPKNSHVPKDSEFLGTNFFCYATDVGYISFGWWLPAELNSSHEHCVPRPDKYDWFEYGTGVCDDVRCRVHAINYLTNDTQTPHIDSNYVATSLDFGNGEKGQLALSYFDEDGGGYGVGTRQVISENPEWVNDCHGAFQTLQEVKQNYSVPVGFQLTNPCSPLAKDDKAAY